MPTKTLYSAKPSVKTKRIAVGLAITGSILLLLILIASHGIATPLVAEIGHLLIGAFGTAGSLTLSSLLLVGGLLANNSESANPSSVREFFRGLKVALKNIFTFGRKSAGLRLENTNRYYELPAQETGGVKQGYYKDKKPSPWIKWLGIGLAIFAVVSMLALIIASHGIATPLLAALGHSWITAFGLKGSFVLSSLLLAGGSLSTSSESAYPGSVKRFFKGIGMSLANMLSLGLKTDVLQKDNASIKDILDENNIAKRTIYKPAALNAKEFDISTRNTYNRVWTEEIKGKETSSSDSYKPLPAKLLS